MKKYEIPEIKVSAFDAEDIITASGLTPAADTTYAGGETSTLYMKAPAAEGITIPDPFK